MRVPDYLLFSIFQEQDARIRRQLADKTLEVATGKRYRNISDEPVATYRVLELKKEIAQLSQHSRNRLFADSVLTYVEFNLGKIEDTLNSLHAKLIQAKNHLLDKDQLVAIGELFSVSLRSLLDRLNDQLGGNYLFGGASLTQKPFDERTLEYTASSESFSVWLSDSHRVEVFLSGREAFGMNVALWNRTFASPDEQLGTSGTIRVNLDGLQISVNYTSTQTLRELVQAINASYGHLLRAEVSQNPDKGYTLMLLPVEVSKNMTVHDTSNVGFSSFNLLQAVKRLADKLSSGLHPDESDLLLIKRAFDRVSFRRAQVGSLLSQVKNLQPVQENLKNQLDKQKSDVEDADLSQSIMEYTRYRLAYEALMRIVAEQKDLTILKYL